MALKLLSITSLLNHGKMSIKPPLLMLRSSRRVLPLPPATGPYTLSITFNVSIDIEYYVIAEPWKDVDQTTPLDAQVTATGASRHATVDVSSAAGDVVTDIAYCEATAGGNSLTAGAS